MTTLEIAKLKKELEASSARITANKKAEEERQAAFNNIQGPQNRGYTYRGNRF